MLFSHPMSPLLYSIDQSLRLLSPHCPFPADFSDTCTEFCQEQGSGDSPFDLTQFFKTV